MTYNKDNDGNLMLQINDSDDEESEVDSYDAVNIAYHEEWVKEWKGVYKHYIKYEKERAAMKRGDQKDEEEEMEEEPEKELIEGRIENIMVIKALNLPNDLMSKPDGFLKVKCGDIDFRTVMISTKEGEQWNEVFRVEEDNIDEIQFELYGEEKLSPKYLVAKALVGNQEMKNGKKKYQFPLVDKEGNAIQQRDGKEAMLEVVIECSGYKNGEEEEEEEQQKPQIEHITVLKALNLPNTDLMSKTDAFVIVKVGRDELRTKVISTKQDAEWNQKFVIHEDVKDIVLELWDEDRFSKDDLIAKIVIEKEDLQKGVETYRIPLDLLDKNGNAIRQKVGKQAMLEVEIECSGN